MSLSVLGAGAFGTALAVALARGGTPVALWARNPDQAAAMTADRSNPRLPDVRLPDSITPTSDLNVACAADILLLAVPMQQLSGLLAQMPQTPGQHLVACCKGIDLEAGIGPTGLITRAHPDATAAVLTGPSFAADIAIGLPTALTLASTDRQAAKTLQVALSTPTLRLYRSADPVGAELGGALKNVIAIACGACIGSGLGDSARAALMTRGFAEMRRFADAFGAEPDTLLGLSGFGDLALTCGSDLSRNYRFGLALGQNADFDPAATVEGAATARAVARIAEDRSLDMPICAEVAQLTTGQRSVPEAMRALLSRPLKEE
ncbi:NAD(P)H-dependent glycerol-3-phosphate dehydrogenase [Aestuariicoccus sp. MJ-SS9]|uniref:NAD(P)H-dependent glycerol-3-phosphate dehydrogenase n=1 Tax=Aestuariicoccus sp. MJ-SS9 TaxID=3079855 RepID=UPI002907AE7F|nr:NAD(P)H-dependent glycerol-3-phosphate dehydrogenase [Aestuariicoccus sp. MJ-SS9]MDU8910018.1 NAD(P)H-dependent glycerol-3-phosphate dehydrogenase [Aestuariicoccus sp. MJ-SS9]